MSLMQVQILPRSIQPITKMKAYKLTDHNGQTRNGTQWGENIEHTATGKDKDLCSDGWIHFYTDPLIAVLMNPRHAYFTEPQLWECETSGEEIHESLKSGCKTLRTIKRIELPSFTPTQLIAFGILCAKVVCKNTKWNNWADKWLSGDDRRKHDASAAASAAYAASATSIAAYTAAKAASAAYAAAEADAAAYAAAYEAAYAAAYADAEADAEADAAVAVAAAYAAAEADAAAEAYAAAYEASAIKINFVQLANQALTYK